jgi:hypothetical protein
MTESDTDALGRPIAPDAIRIDPVGSAPSRGREAINESFEGALTAAGIAVIFTVSGLHGSAEEIAFEFQYGLPTDTGRRRLAGINVFTLSADGSIERAFASWGDDDWSDILG